MSPGLPGSALLLLVSFICCFLCNKSSFSNKQIKTEARKEARMKAIKDALKRGWESIGSVTGAVSNNLASSIIYTHLTSTVASG